MHPDLSRLCIHTITTKPWDLEEALDRYSRAGVGGISVWQDAVAALGSRKAGDLIRQYPVDVVSYVRGGFFPAADPQARLNAIDRNKKMLDEAADIGAPILVLVCGADPGQPLELSRAQIRDGIEAVIPHAAANGVQLAIEPLHPMYADTRSAVNTLEQANDMAEYFNSEWVGIAVDVYHLWWDPHLEDQIARCGRNGNLSAFHICDWNTPTSDMLNDRGLMGEGCIPLHQISNWVERTGFSGYREVEIFSNRLWQIPQQEFLDKIISAYLKIW